MVTCRIECPNATRLCPHLRIGPSIPHLQVIKGSKGKGLTLEQVCLPRIKPRINLASLFLQSMHAGPR